MTGSMIVNNLAGLMMLTSLFVISVKSYRLSCGFYACQSLVLVSIFATLSCLFAAEQYPAANFWLLPDGKRLPSGAGASCLASTGTGGNRYRYRRHLRRHCDGVTGKKNMAYPRHAGREQLDRAEGIMR